MECPKRDGAKTKTHHKQSKTNKQSRHARNLIFNPNPMSANTNAVLATQTPQGTAYAFGPTPLQKG